MKVVYERCCGLDVHKKTVVACLIAPGSGSQANPGKEIRTFGTMTADLLALTDWLRSVGCTHVAMESTGIYWKPVYNLLEGQFEVLVVNVQHIKAVPGRKTDVKDAEWIAELLQHGLLQPSFIPPSEQFELRDLTRYRSTLIAEHLSHIDYLDEAIERVSEQIEEQMRPFEEELTRLDLHKRTVVACMIVPGPDTNKQTHKEIRSFGTMTEDLLRLSDWLLSNRVTHVAMESTGVLWKPIYNLLEGNFELLLVNPAHIKQCLVARPKCETASG